MGPAKLSYPILMVAAVGGVIIGGNHSLEGFPQNGSENLGSTAYSNGEVDNQGGDKDPKIPALPLALPPGFIDVEIARCA